MKKKMFKIMIMTVMIMGTSLHAFLKTGAAYLTEACSLKTVSATVPMDVMVKIGLGATATTMLSNRGFLSSHVGSVTKGDACFDFYKTALSVGVGGFAGYCLRNQRLAIGCMGAFVGIQLFSKMVDVCNNKYKKFHFMNERNKINQVVEVAREMIRNEHLHLPKRKAG